MNCHEARRLLSCGITPGSSSSERAALGFHLASCAGCRAYRTTLQDRLLAGLLAQGPGTTPSPRTASLTSTRLTSAPVSAAPQAARRSVSGWLAQMLWYTGITVLATIVLGVVLTFGIAARSLFHIHQNVQAMSAPSPAAAIAATSPSALPALTPTHTPLPSATLQPTHPPPSVTPTRTPTPTATPTPAPPPAGQVVNVLLLGSDQRPGETDPSRTDAIIIARIDPVRHRVALLSLPRDLWVEIPGYGYARINAANVWGATYGEPGGGLALARKTVAHLLGIPIDYTTYINFQGFIGAIDSIGGITVNVPTELYDPQFPTMDYGYVVAHFLAGPQHMDGATALMYSRIRHSDSDFARMRRQQAVLASILTQLRDQNVLESLKRIEDVTTALRGYVQTDIPEDRLLGLAWSLRDLSADQIEHYVLDENMVSFGVGNDRYAEVVDPSALAALTEKFLGQTIP